MNKRNTIQSDTATPDMYYFKIVNMEKFVFT